MVNPKNRPANRPALVRRSLRPHYAGILFRVLAILVLSHSIALAAPSHPLAAGPVPEGVKLDRSKMKVLTGKDNDRQYPQKDVLVRHRPMTAADHGASLVVENLRIDDVVNQKAIDVGLSSPDGQTADGEPFTYKSVVIRNCEITNIRRDLLGRANTLHIDFIRVCGGGDQQPFETDLLIEDCFMKGGDALPLIIQDGKFSTITLRRIRFEDAGHGSVQIVFMNTGYARKVVIEECPGMRVALMGRPGTVEECVVRNSPGAEVVDPATPKGRTGALVLREDPKAQINPDEPKDTASSPSSPILALIQAMKETGTPSPSLEPLTPTAAPATRPAIPQSIRPLPVPPPTLHEARDTTKTPTGPAKIIVEPTTRGTVRVRVENVSEDQLAFVLFEAFTTLNYRLGSPVIITQSPWEAELPISKPGHITITATLTRLGGNPDKPLAVTVDVPRR